MRSQQGFNLIELMIGLAIALLGLLAVGQVMLTFIKQRTTITQTMATQSNGVMALYRMEKDIGQAGYGLMSLTDCTTITNGVTPANPAIIPAPIIITDGGASSDTVTVQYANPAAGTPGTQLISMSSTQYTVPSEVGFGVGDYVVATTTAPNCTATKVTSATAGSGALGYSPPLSASTTAGYLTNLGNLDAASFVSHRYTATTTSNALTVAEYPAYSANTLVDDVILVKAQYGMASTSTSTTASNWLNGSTTVNASNADRIVAVRIGVVARSPLYEKEVIDAPQTLSVLPAMTGTSTVSAPAAGSCATDNTSGEVKCTMPDTHYRYRAYSTVIPLKNVIWTR